MAIIDKQINIFFMILSLFLSSQKNIHDRASFVVTETQKKC